MHGFLKVRFINFFLNGANHLRCHWLITGASFDDEKAQRPDLKFFRLRVFDLGSRPDFATEGAFHDGFEGGFSSGSEGLGFDQKVVGKVECGFHIWVTVWFYGCLSSYWGLR